MIVTCPKCRQEIEADDSMAGRIVSCPGCQGKFTLPRSRPQGAAAKASAPPAAPEDTWQADVLRELRAQTGVLRELRGAIMAVILMGLLMGILIAVRGCVAPIMMQ